MLLLWTELYGNWLSFLELFFNKLHSYISDVTSYELVDDFSKNISSHIPYITQDADNKFVLYAS